MMVWTMAISIYFPHQFSVMIFNRGLNTFDKESLLPTILRLTASQATEPSTGGSEGMMIMVMCWAEQVL